MISFVILNWNSGAYLEEALRSVAGQGQTDLEVVVVDNGSTNGSLPRLRQLRDDGVVNLLIEVGENIGYAAGMNLGIERASGAVIVPMNSDVVLDSGFAAQMSRYAGSPVCDGAPIGMVAVPVYAWDYEEGQLSERTDRLVGIGASLMRRLTTSPWHPAFDAPESLLGPEGSVPVYTREALEAARRADGHYFEPGYFAYLEDTDLLLRVREAGFGVAVDTVSRAWHIGSASTGGVLRASGKPLWLRSVVHANRYKSMRKLPTRGERLVTTALLLLEDAFTLATGGERRAALKAYVANYRSVAASYRPRRLRVLPVCYSGAARSATARYYSRTGRLPEIGPRSPLDVPPPSTAPTPTPPHA